MKDTPDLTPPSLEEIRSTAAAIAPYVDRTPVQSWRGPELGSRMGADTQVHLKLELFQRTGTFKARAAVNNVLALTAEQRSRGVTTVSAGNHAIATAYAAACFGAHAKVVMLASANPARVEAARRYGAEVVLAPDGKTGFEMVDRIQQEEGRALVHAFEGKRVTAATAGVGLEIFEDVADVDVVIVPIGAGGLCSGVSRLAKLLHPRCKVYGVEPFGSGVMTKSLKAGSPQRVDRITTIADSLGPPMTLPYVYAMVSRFVDEVVQISDDEMAAAAAILFAEMKLALEPAGAASTAGMLGPLRDKVRGRRVVPIVCGTNIDADGFRTFLARGQEALKQGVLTP